MLSNFGSMAYCLHLNQLYSKGGGNKADGSKKMGIGALKIL